MRLALMAPIEVPMTQSGSMPASCSALVDAGLVGPERAAALQHEHDLAREVPADRRDALRRKIVLHALHVLLRPWLWHLLIFASERIFSRQSRHFNAPPGLQSAIATSALPKRRS
jgi:hypothetical protein